MVLSHCNFGSRNQRKQRKEEEEAKEGGGFDSTKKTHATLIQRADDLTRGSHLQLGQVACVSRHASLVPPPRPPDGEDSIELAWRSGFSVPGHQHLMLVWGRVVWRDTR